MTHVVFENKIRPEPVDESRQAFEIVHHGSLPARRRFELIRLARRQGQLSVTELSSQFGVSPDTIRRDLDLLSVRGLVRRTHGGAVPADNLAQGESPFAQRIHLRTAEKTRIAQCAASLIQNGETLIINGGSTTRIFAFELAGKKNLTVVTNALGIPASLPDQAVRDIFVLGGEYRAESQITVGSIACCGSTGVSVDSAILGVAGVTEDGLFAKLLQEATMTGSMIAAARRTIILADSTKFGQKLLGHIASLGQIDILVTDAEPPKKISDVLNEFRVQVVVAPPLNPNRNGKPSILYHSV
jgi:DeoR family transcriptional regulator, fructose operon transcriptional repressor